VQGGERARDEMISVLQVAASSSIIDWRMQRARHHDRYGKRHETDGGSRTRRISKYGSQAASALVYNLSRTQ
jgi:hypothetical protein